LLERIVAGAFLGALLVGGIGFVAGFVGPILLMPESNQGPLLGIFITGPLGAIVGAIAGAIVAWRRGRR
jgi:hypothetical protein